MTNKAKNAERQSKFRSAFVQAGGKVTSVYLQPEAVQALASAMVYGATFNDLVNHAILAQYGACHDAHRTSKT